MIHEFLKNSNGEIVADGDKPYLIRVEFIPYKQWPYKIKAKFEEFLENDKKANLGLDILEIKDNDERIEKYAFCKNGGFDNKADIDADGNHNPEYFDCPLRDKCDPEAQRLLCGCFPAPNGTLFPKEILLIKEIALDLPYKQIADRLDISQNTIHTHVSNITKKIGCDSKAGIVRFAVNNRIV